MSVVAPPPQDELELLIREARARQRRRRVLGLAVIAAVVGLSVAVYAAVAGRRPAQTQGRSGSTAVASLPGCRSDQLRLSAPKMWGAAAGSLYDSLTFVNTSSSSCAVAGWPAVRRLGRGGAAIPVRVERWVFRQSGPAPYRTVSLRPGAAATFEVFGQDWNHERDRPCPTARVIEVKPPGRRSWLSIDRKVPACAVWDVGPLVPGREANPPSYALSVFYEPPSVGHPFYSGRENGTSWRLRVRDSADGRYCFRVSTDGAARAGRCGRLNGPGVPGKLGWVARSHGRSFVAGAVVSRAQVVAVALSDGQTRYLQTMPPTRVLAPRISFFFTTIPRGTYPVAIRGHTHTGRRVVTWNR